MMFSIKFRQAVGLLAELEKEKGSAGGLTIKEIKTRLRCRPYDRDTLRLMGKMSEAGLIGRKMRNGSWFFFSRIEPCALTVYDLVMIVDNGVHISHNDYLQFFRGYELASITAVEGRLEKKIIRILKNIPLSDMIPPACTSVGSDPMPAGRGPGRPCREMKHAPHDTGINNEVPGAAPVKRGPGRPRKIRVES